MGCKRIGEGLYQVASQTVAGRCYTVDLKGSPTCQCPHYYHRLRGLPGAVCRHIEAAQAKCAAVTAAKARTIPDVEIDELAARWEAKGRTDVSGPLYAEIRRRGAEAVRREAPLKPTSLPSEETLRAIFA